MRFVPDHVSAQPGDRLELTVVNEDTTTAHDLMLADGTTTGRIAPGATSRLVVPVVPGPLDGWCTVVGHRGMGMVFRVDAPSPAIAASATAPHASAEDATAPLRLDLTQPPGADHPTRDATLPAPTPSPTFTVTEHVREVAPGHRMKAMTYNGQVMGPILRSPLGGALTVHLENKGSMGHSLDMHAGTVAPDRVMRTIAPGESLDYPIRTDHAGIWLYHCSTMPMTVHLSSGMFGALIVPPRGLGAVDHEWVIVQSEAYLAPGSDTHAGAEVSSAKIAAERPDAILWNGHVNQYVHAPLQAKAGERVRIWVLNAGPSRTMSFHVVGGVFDTVFKEGAYLLRSADATGGGAQALDLAAAQGGFVELTFHEAGTYTAVSHSFVDMERGARAIIRVS